MNGLIFDFGRAGGEVMIKLQNLTKRFGQTVAVDNLNLEVKRGECFVFLGPNAAGKTTTIKLIIGLLKPTSGSVYVAGYNLAADYLKAKRYISYIPDVPYLYDKLTGWEFLTFIARLFCVPQREVNERIETIVGIFGLDKYQYQLIENYSHGLKQRLVICAALIHNPELIVVDEPMVALDPLAIRLVKDIFLEKIKQGATIFMSTHTLSVASEMATRIGIIHKGRLVAIGTQAELQELTHTRGELEEIFLQLTEESK